MSIVMTLNLSFFFLLLPLSNLRAWKFTFMFSCKSFIVWTLTFSSLIHFGLIFAYGMRWSFKFNLFYMKIHLSQDHLLKKLFIPNGLGTLIEKQQTTGSYLDSQFYSTGLCAYPNGSTTLSWSLLLIMSFEIKSVRHPTLFFFNIVLALLGPSHLCVNFGISLLISTKLARILTETVLNL